MRSRSSQNAAVPWNADIKKSSKRFYTYKDIKRAQLFLLDTLMLQYSKEDFTQQFSFLKI